MAEELIHIGGKKPMTLTQIIEHQETYHFICPYCAKIYKPELAEQRLQGKFHTNSCEYLKLIDKVTKFGKYHE